MPFFQPDCIFALLSIRSPKPKLRSMQAENIRFSRRRDRPAPIVPLCLLTSFVIFSKLGDDVGEICTTPPSPSFVASLDSFVPGTERGVAPEEPAAWNLHGGICEGRECWSGHGRPKRARSWKRRIQPRHTYSGSASLLLGEMSGNCYGGVPRQRRRKKAAGVLPQR
jgi:hypothetical protein